MMQSPPVPSPGPGIHQHHAHNHHPAAAAAAAAATAAAAHSPFFAAFSQRVPLDGSGGVQLHPAFLHPLYPLPPGLASLRAAAGAGLLAAAAAGGNAGSAPASPDRNKSFTIDAILGREAQKLAASSSSSSSSSTRRSPPSSSPECQDISMTMLMNNMHSNNHNNTSPEGIKLEGIKSEIGALYSHHRRDAPGHNHHHPHHHHSGGAPGGGGGGGLGRPHPRLHGPGVPHPHHPYLGHSPLIGQLTCNPGFSFRHHTGHNPYSRDKSDKKSLGVSNSDWKAGKAKRVRTIFTPEQLERMEAEFERQQYMVGTERYYLAASLNLTEAQVKVWFQNRRIKWRKQNLEQQHAKLAKLDLLAKHADDEDEDDEDSESESEAEVQDIVHTKIQDGGGHVGDGDVTGEARPILGEDDINVGRDTEPVSPPIGDFVVKTEILVNREDYERHCPIN